MEMEVLIAKKENPVLLKWLEHIKKRDRRQGLCKPVLCLVPSKDAVCLEHHWAEKYAEVFEAHGTPAKH